MSEWKECKIGDVATVHGGKRLPKGKMLISLPTNHPYIRITDFNGHKILLDGIQYVDDEIQKSIARYTVDAGDLVISIVGTLGLCAIIPKELDKANLTENCAKIHIKEDDVEKLFLYYQLISTETQDTIVGFDVGSTQPKLPLYNVQNIKLLLPPLPEQRAIAGVLSSLDDKIDLLHRQNKTLEGMAEALWRKMFVEEADPGWKKGKLGDFVSVTTGKGLKKDEYIENGVYPVIGANGEIGRTNKYLTDEKLILTGRVGTLGEIKINNEKIWISDNVLILKPLKNIHFYFVYFLLKRIDFENLNVGSTQPLVTQTDLKNIEIELPNNDILDYFATWCESGFNKIEKNVSQIRTLSRLRDTLLPKLISGEVRVKS
jgi:type I restriction enzyme S subunit